MTRDELNCQLLQLVNILRQALAGNRDWDESSDWSRKVNLTDRVSVAYSPGDHATALTVTFADGGVVDLIPPDFDDPEYKPPAGQDPSHQRRGLEVRTRRYVECVNHFGGWHHSGTLVRTVTLGDGSEVSRVVRADGKLLITIVGENALTPPDSVS